MNKIEEAASLLEQGWCTGILESRDKDKHCAVGAVAAATQTMRYINFDGVTYVDDEGTYNAFSKTPEAFALATEIMESDWFAENDADLQNSLKVMFASGQYDAVVFYFNDSHDTKEPVIEMFRYAAKRMH